MLSYADEAKNNARATGQRELRAPRLVPGAFIFLAIVIRDERRAAGEAAC